MKKYVLYIALVCLLISNIVTLSFFIKYHNKYINSNNVLIKNIAILDGKDSDWKLDNGLLINSGNKLIFKSNSIEYIGKDVLKIKSLSINVSYKNEMLFSVIHQAKGEKISLVPHSKIQLGSSIQNIEKNNFNVYNPILLIIKYITQSGKTITHEIKLNSNTM